MGNRRWNIYISEQMLNINIALASAAFSCGNSCIAGRRLADELVSVIAWQVEPHAPREEKLNSMNRFYVNAELEAKRKTA